VVPVTCAAFHCTAQAYPQTLPARLRKRSIAVYYIKKESFREQTKGKITATFKLIVLFKSNIKWCFEMYQTPTFSLQDQSFAFKTFLYVFTYE